MKLGKVKEKLGNWKLCKAKLEIGNWKWCKAKLEIGNWKLLFPMIVKQKSFPNSSFLILLSTFLILLS